MGGSQSYSCLRPDDTSSAAPSDQPKLLGGIFPTQAGDLESRFEEGIEKVAARCRGEYGLQQFANDACADLGGPDDCGDLIADLWSFYAGFL